MPTTDTQRIAAAQAYVDALVDHRADAVPFAANCTRIEVGLKTGFSGNHLRRSLNRGPQYRVIAAVLERTEQPGNSRDALVQVLGPLSAGRRCRQPLLQDSGSSAASPPSRPPARLSR